MGEPSFLDDDTERIFFAEEVTKELALDVGWNEYTKKSKHKWTLEDKEECKWLLNNILDNPHYNPLNMEILAVELFFDIEIPDEWARYSYNINGKKLEGQLHLRGTIDLVTTLEDGTIYGLDYKTGKRWNYDTDSPKGYNDFKDDFQLNLYHYVLRKLYPGRNIFFTICYIRENRYYTIPFEQEDSDKVYSQIRYHFETLRDNQSPTKTDEIWKCKICSYYTEKMKGSNKSICKYVRDSIKEEGIELTTNKLFDFKKFNAYTGGGKENKDVK